MKYKYYLNPPINNRSTDFENWEIGQMSKYSSMTIDELQCAFNKIDKIQFPEEALDIHEELLNRKRNRLKESMEKEKIEFFPENANDVRDTKGLKAPRSIFIFLLFLAAKYIGAILYTVFHFIYKAHTDGSLNIQNSHLDSLIYRFTEEHINQLFTVELIFSGLTVFILAKLLAKDSIRKVGDHAIGWVWESNEYTWQALLTGIGLGLIAISLSSGGNAYPKFKLDFSNNQWFEIMCVITTILFLAPVVEEFLFRGILYVGFLNSWSKGISSFFVTLLFVIIHLPAVEYQILPLFFISVLAILTLTFRIISGYIWPSIFIHFSYNLVILCYMFKTNT